MSSVRVDRALRDAEQDARHVVLDLSELTFMDAAGLSVVIDASRRASAAARRFVVRVRSACVRRLFELTRAERWLEIVVAGEATAPGIDGRPSPSSPYSPERFGWELVRDGSSVRVAPVGELDLATRAHVEQAIDDVMRSGVDRLILDLRRLSFMDSSGLRLALDLHAAASGDASCWRSSRAHRRSGTSSRSRARSTRCRSRPPLHRLERT